MVQFVAAADRQLLGETRLLLTALSKSLTVVKEDSGHCRSLFADILKEQPFFSNFGTADLDGKVFCDAAGSARTNIAGRDYFQEAVRTRRFALGDYAPAGSSSGHSIDLGYPILSETGQPEGVVFASLDLKALVWVGEDPLPENMAVLIIDSKGTILARCPNADKWTGRSMPDAPLIKAMLNRKEGFLEEKDLDGVLRNFAFTSVAAGASGKLLIAAGISEKPFNWLSEEMLQNAATLLGIIALFAFAAGWLAARHLPAEK